MSEFRDYPEQYKWANRDFRPYDRVVFIGPPPDADQPMLTARPEDHKLYHKQGNIEFGNNSSIRCYPDEPDDSELGRMVWVTFENDTQLVRQVDHNWLVRIEDFQY